MKIIKATDENRLKLIEDLYMRAFPKAERKPFQLMVKKQAEGTMELLSIEEENKFLGLAIFAHDKDIALESDEILAVKKKKLIKISK